MGRVASPGTSGQESQWSCSFHLPPTTKICNSKNQSSSLSGNIHWDNEEIVHLLWSSTRDPEFDLRIPNLFLQIHFNITWRSDFRIYWAFMQGVTTIYSSLLHSHWCPQSQSSPVFWWRLQTADVPFPLGSRTVAVPRPQQLLTNSLAVGHLVETSYSSLTDLAPMTDLHTHTVAINCGW